ncbi:hypothetical protein C7S20_17460 [Christiangramia fulva]|uniref:Glycosyl transferase family 1 domain-containing protein n=1 Tax=Christiangramia fulva TaxID=2126553 RepID=A0A2R3Z9E0_9FLAO|nr:glycosyltransferase [Christiangramia fulva]AVR46905.1 hypothetical protein C7S20_17460 [Christiangramia fulva]
MSPQCKTEEVNDTKKLKILFIVRNFPTISETFILNQIIYLINQGHYLRILAINYKKTPLQNQIEEYDLMNRVEFINMPPNLGKRFIKFLKLLRSHNFKKKITLLNLLNPFKYGKESLNLAAFYKGSWINRFQDDFDIAHAHFGFTSDIFFKAKEVGFFKKTKLITSFHGHDMVVSEIKKNRKRYKELFSSNSILTTNNLYAKSLLLKIEPGYEPIHLLPVSLDTNLFDGRCINDSRNVKIVFCGRLVFWKGPHLFVEIANFLINTKKIKNIEFEMIGEGKERSHIESLIREYNLQSYLKVRGSLKQNEIIKIFRRSQIFVSPGLTDKNKRAETQGLVIQEAQAMQMPVLVSTAGGMRFGILEQESGFVLPEGDIKGFCDKIDFLINNPTIREEMGAKGREYVVKNFDIIHLGKRLEGIYYEALKNDA